MVRVEYRGASDLEDRAIRQIAALAMDAPARAKSGHSGTAMALAPLGVVLFNRVMRHDPLQPSWIDRDRFVLSCGHASILQYALAATFGYDLGVGDLEQFRQLHSRTPGHPEADHTPTVEVTTGPLGQGIADSVGLAMAERILRAQFGEDLVSHRTWVLAGDGCMEEGISHEAASLAGKMGLDRLTIFYDDNHITIDGPTELALADDTPARFAAYGWHVLDLGESANDLLVLDQACRDAMAETTRPTLIVVRSHIGFPSPTMMDRKEAHGSPFQPEAITEAKALLGVPDTPFLFNADLTRQLISERRADDGYLSWSARLAASGSRGESLLARMVARGVNVDAPLGEMFDGDKPVPIRRATERLLASLSPVSPGLVSGSADLTDNTLVTLPGVALQSAKEPGGRQVHYGIREFAMSATMVGIARHGGLRPLGSTFFVFSDYARPAIRLAALSRASVLFVYTHDSIGVGEDGPTHQPIEHLMSLRAMPGLHVVRPSDANEAVRLAHGLLTDPHMSPTALVLSRQEVPLLRGSDATRSVESAHRGGYVVRESPGAQLTLVATGSEVTMCLAAADELESDCPVRVVALPCWACFSEQPTDYRAAVLRRDLPSLAVEAGATLGWERYADEAMGLDTFGTSAPGPAVFENFGLTVGDVVIRVRDRLGAAS
jgi:transketolase